MERKYIAFISYRHLPLEMSIAKKLHRRIEHYRIPRDLRKDGADRLGYVFRDQEELPISSNLSANIQEALDHSEYLIVICSPETVKSRWVLGEIDYFLRGHPRDHILAVLAAGTPETAFPPQLTRPEEEGGLPIEPLAANLLTDSSIKREQLFRRESLRILAALIGCPFDALYQREARYQRRRRSAAIGIAAAIAAAFIGMLLNRNAQIRAQLERAQISESTALASLSENAYREGDLNGALEYALQALPSEENPRPYVPAAELALSGELNIYRQGLLSYARSFTQDSAILRMAVSPDGRLLATADSAGVLRLFDCETGSPVWQAEYDWISILSFADDDTLLVSGPSGTRAHSTADGSPLWQAKELDNLNLLALSDDGKTLLPSDFAEPAHADAESISLRSAETGEILKTLRLAEHAPRFCPAAALNGDASRAALLLTAAEGDASLVLCDFTSSSAKVIEDGLPYSAGATAYRLVFTPGGDLALACDNMQSESFVMLFDSEKDWEIRFRTGVETEKTAQVVNGYVLSLGSLDYFAAGEDRLVMASKQTLLCLSQENGGILWQRTLPGVPLAAKMYANGVMGLVLSDGTVTACTDEGVLTYMQDIISFTTGYPVSCALIAGGSYGSSRFVLVPEDAPGQVSVLEFVEDASMSLLAGLPEGIVRFALLPSPSGERLACLLVDSAGELLSWILMDPLNHTTSGPFPWPASLPQDLSLLSLDDEGELTAREKSPMPDTVDGLNISVPGFLKENASVRRILPVCEGQYFAVFFESGEIRICTASGDALCDIPESRVRQRFSSEASVYHAAVSSSGDRLLLFYDDLNRPEPLCIVVDMTQWECVGIFDGPAAYLPGDDSVLVFRQLAGLYASPFWSRDELLRKAGEMVGQGAAR